MYTSVNIPITFRNNHRRQSISADLDVADCAGFLIDLWLYAAMSYGEDGVLRGMDVFDIAYAAGWGGDPNLFVDALLCGGVLYVKNGTYAVSGWENTPVGEGER